ncbi:MAG TPA: LPS export ABC transporter periplasmic protein LptC [Casimicrobiaceae bacterium]|nr:LPS export ABC transporter periplasmic protein LptC [Casimicrobiaceae bacterium]
MKARHPLFDRLIAWSPVLVLGSLAALSYWLNAQVQRGGPAFDGSGRHDPDIYIEDVNAQSLDAEGRVRQALTARVVRHYPDDDTSDFDAPVVTFSDPGQPKLTITSDRATVTGDREHAYFYGNVRGVREPTEADARDGPVILLSEYLHVIPKEDRVVTDKPVTIEDARGIIRATGMEFDNRSKTVKFGSHVSGRLQPQK